MVFCPGALFFTHVIDWPQGLEGADLAAFVALAIEELSPFALDSLAWGFCCDEAQRSIFLYAACLPRISAAEQEQWPLAEHVYPAFLPLLGQREGRQEAAAQARHELLLTSDEVLLLGYAAGSRWPNKIIAESLGEQEQPAQSAAFATAAKLLVKARLAPDVGSARAQLTKIPFWQLEAVADGKRGQMVFVLGDLHAATGSASSNGAEGKSATQGESAVVQGEVRAQGESAVVQGESTRQGVVTAAQGESTARRNSTAAAGAARLRTTLIGEENLWRADVRDEAFIALARKERATGQRLWYGLGAAVAVAIVLLVLLLVSFWLSSLLQKRSATLGAQTAAVERVRQDQDLLMRMRQFSAEPFAPFSLIGALKASKPAPIYFDSIELSGPDAVVVEGQGPTVDAVNAYVQSLEQSGFFRAARQTRMNLRDGASVFTLYLQYLGEPPKLPQEAAAAQTAASTAVAGRQTGGTDAALPVSTAEDDEEGEGWDVSLPADLAVLPMILNQGTEATPPSGAVVVGASASQNTPQQGEQGWRSHVVNSGETLGTLAARYGVPISVILEANPDVDPQALSAGQVILIPAP